MSATTRGRLGAHVLAFYALQAGNYLLPMLSLPVLARALGAEAFGVLSLATAVATFAVIATDSGFQAVTSRLLGRAAGRPRRIAGLVAANLAVRGAIALPAAAIAFGAALAWFPDLRAHPSAIGLALLTVLGTIAFPFSYLAATEQGEVIAVCTLAGRGAAVAAMLALLRSPDDLYLAIGLQSGALPLSAALFFAVFGRTRFPRLRAPTRRELRAVLLGARRLWPLNAARSTASNITVPMLASFEDAAVVGTFAMVEKVVRALGSGFHPLILALTPHFIKAHAQRGERHPATRRAMLGVTGVLVASIAALVGTQPLWMPLLMPEARDAFPLVALLSVWLAANVSCELLLGWKLLPEGRLGEAGRRSVPVWLAQPVLVAAGAFLFSAPGVSAALALSETALLVLWSLPYRDARRSPSPMTAGH